MKQSTKLFLKKHRKTLTYSIIASVIVLAIVIMFISSSVSTALAKRSRDFTPIFEFYKENKLNTQETPSISLDTTKIVGNKDIHTVSGKTVARIVGSEETKEADELNSVSAAKFVFNVPNTGYYYLDLEYQIFGIDIQSDHVCSIRPNDIAELSELYQTIQLPVYWQYDLEGYVFATNSLGNDVLPLQKTIDGFMRTYARDAKTSIELGVPFYFEAGENNFEISMLRGRVYFASVTLVPAVNHISYEAYSSSNQGKPAATAKTTVQAEHFAYKDEITVQPVAIRNMNCYPYDTFEQRLNVLKAHKGGNRITYNFDVAEAGMYKIGFNYASEKANTTAYRRIMIDGKTPFGELLHYPFGYERDYTYHKLGMNGTDFEFYLTAGTHTLTMEIDGVVMATLVAPFEQISKELSDLYLELKKLVGPTADANRDWKVFDFFPNIVDDFTRYIDVIETQKALYQQFNGGTIETPAIVKMNSALRVLRYLLEDPDKIPNRVANISEGTDSIVQSISAATAEIEVSPLFVDAIFITGSATTSDYKKNGTFAILGDNLKSFFGSFFRNLSMDKDEDTIEIWMNRSLNMVDLLQNLADTDFTKKTGIRVNVSMLKDEGKLIMANASGINPDGVIGLSTYQPYELGLRGLTYDLKQFPDSREVASRFAPGAMIPYYVDDKLWGIPESTDAQLIYYRKDILDRLGLSVPDTWEDVIKMLPVLQRNGMNFYAPLSANTAAKSIGTTAPFIYQHGGSLYADDGLSTAIDSEASIKGIQLMTDLYTIYGLPLQTASFAESFRQGTLPIGIAGFGLYSQLLVTAPELVGLWDIAPSPGVYNQSTGEVERWNNGISSACAILSKSEHPDKVWEFMKWWMSTEIQMNYALQVRSIWGNQFIWASANLDAFRTSVFSAEHKDYIYEQWDWLLEIPRLPGWYMIERELSNSWNYIVFDNYNLRQQIDVATNTSNREIIRKMTEYGYLDSSGNPTRNYKVTTVQDIENWIGGK